jgi:sporulation-control protein spo0M
MFVVFLRQDDSLRVCKEVDRRKDGAQDDLDEGLKVVQRVSREVFLLVFQEQGLRQQKSLQGFLWELALEQEELQEEK